MILIAAIAVCALGLGLMLPKHWGLWGFLGASAVLFIAQAAINTSLGFSGTSLEESLLLFNGSYAAYVGFNIQLTYRDFALPELILATSFITRLTRSAA